MSKEIIAEHFVNSSRGPGLILKNKEKLFDPVQIYESVTGERKHKSVIYRQMLRGVRGVFYEFVSSGGRMKTSREATVRFLTACTAAVSVTAEPRSPIDLPKLRSENARKKAADKAARLLSGAGI